MGRQLLQLARLSHRTLARRLAIPTSPWHVKEPRDALPSSTSAGMVQRLFSRLDRHQDRSPWPGEEIIRRRTDWGERNQRPRPAPRYPGLEGTAWDRRVSD